jgi:hypothetical protein
LTKTRKWKRNATRTKYFNTFLNPISNSYAKRPADVLHVYGNVTEKMTGIRLHTPHGLQTVCEELSTQQIISRRII